MLLTDNLIAFWPQDEASGNVLDASGNANHLTELSGSLGAATLNSIPCRAYARADSECAYDPDDTWNNLSGTSFTICGLLRMSNLAAGSFQAAWSKDGSGTQREATLYYQQSGSRFHFVAANTGGTTDLTLNSFGAPSINTWYFFASWYDADVVPTPKVYGQINNGTIDVPEHSMNSVRVTEGNRTRSFIENMSGRPTIPWIKSRCRSGLINGTPLWWRSKCSADGVMMPCKD